MFVRNFFIYVFLFCTVFSSFAMVYDNRFIFLRERQLLYLNDKKHSVILDGFVATASEAVRNDETSSIPALFGVFDFNHYVQAFVKAGHQNPLMPGETIPTTFIKPTAKMQAQGVALSFYTPLFFQNWLSMGINSFFMRVNTFHDFRLDPSVDDYVRHMLHDVGLSRDQATRYGFGDIDWCLRFGYERTHYFKFRSFNIGARVGALVPTGKKRDISIPSSIPFGGNGHWGMYGALDGLFEVREDLKVGFLFRMSKRFPLTDRQRLPLQNEPGIFGVIAGNARVNPGFTFVFSPMIAFENLRPGLGASLSYTMTKHLEDKWSDARSGACAIPHLLDGDPVVENKKYIPVNLEQIEKLSSWGSDYFTLQVFYNFGTLEKDMQAEPIISFKWDIPVSLFVTDNIFKTHKISLGIECAF